MAKPQKFFTKREEEILRHSFTGLKSQDIANLVFCSKRTVDFHLGNAYEKLGVANKMSALVRVREEKLLEGV
jgi:DNA-binding NarL/FixJ family response regulator